GNRRGRKVRRGGVLDRPRAQAHPRSLARPRPAPGRLLRPQERPVRARALTVVMDREEDRWKLVHMHVSVGVPGRRGHGPPATVVGPIERTSPFPGAEGPPRMIARLGAGAAFSKRRP